MGILEERQHAIDNYNFFRMELVEEFNKENPDKEKIKEYEKGLETQEKLINDIENNTEELIPALKKELDYYYQEVEELEKEIDNVEGQREFQLMQEYNLLMDKICDLQDEISEAARRCEKD